MGKRPINREDAVDISFKFGLLMKGIDGLLEIVGGILLIFINPEKLNKIIRLLTQHELSEDPKDKIANVLVMLSSHFSISAQYFGVSYLLSHGTIKFVLIILLLRRKLWAYPLTILSLVLFIVYQIYKYSINPSIFLILLTIFDMVMIVLTYIEYRKIKKT